MKALIKTASALAAFIMMFASSVPCLAAERASYTYTVTFSAGDQGTLNLADERAITVTGGGDYEISRSADGRTVKITGLTLTNQVNFQNSAVVLGDDSKYYVRGVRLGGRDNNTVDYASFPVKCDQDYVVAYGIKGDLTQYTVNYVDENGNVLYPQQVYYGNVGDKPVLAYLYVEGYQPQAYNLTRTLQQDSGKNVFTFVYRPIPAGDAAEGGTAAAPGGTAVSGGAAVPGGAAVSGDGTVPGGTAVSGDGTVPGGATIPGGDAIGAGGAVRTPEDNGLTDLEDENVPLTEPEELVDLDDDEVPLADFDNVQGADGTVAGANRRMFKYTWIALGIGLLALIAAVTGLYFYRKMKKVPGTDSKSEDNER